MKNNVELIENIVTNIEKVIVGKQKEIYDIMKGMISGGHILIEDVPGVGKTTLIKAIKESLSLTYSRIQFTPDLLLEVMEEMQVSEGGITYEVEKPFFIMATENPIEYEGTFSLPEAQLDRFMIKVHLGYPSKMDEAYILNLYRQENPLDKLMPVASKEDIINIQKQVKEIKVNDEINKYIVNIIDATRNHKEIVLGGSTRASLALLRVAQATALIKNRNYVIPEDVKENVKLVLSHRIILTNGSIARGIKAENVLEEILNVVIAPKVRVYVED